MVRISLALFHEIVIKPPLEKGGALKHSRPLSYRFDGLFCLRIEICPRSNTFFRPEEIHPRSCEGPARLSPLIHGGVGIADSLIGANFENIRVSHSHTDAVSTLKTTAIDRYFLTGKKMAHGQRFEPSLAIPFLNAVYADKVLVRKTGERGPRRNIVSVRCEPRKAKWAFISGFPEDSSRFLR